MNAPSAYDLKKNFPLLFIDARQFAERVSEIFFIQKFEWLMNEIYVVPFFGNWAIKMKGKDSPLSTHNRKDEAIRIATKLSQKHKTTLIIMEEEDETNNSELN